MDDPGKKAIGRTSASAAAPAVEADEFAAIRRPRTRHPLLALVAGLLALFLVLKMRADLTYFLSSRAPADLGDARSLLASERGRGVLAEGTNRLVRVSGTPDRESALQVDTKGSWTFTQFFKILGTDSRLFVHRREDPLPAARAEHDVFEGRLTKFSDLSFEDAIRAYFAAHVSTTHFFSADEIRRVLGGGWEHAPPARDLTGDQVALGPNDILAIAMRRPGEIEVALPISRFADASSARGQLVARSVNVIGRGPPNSQHHVFVARVSAPDRDRIMEAIAEIDPHIEIHDAREIVKARLSDLTLERQGLAIRDLAGTTAGGASRILENIDTIRTLGTVLIPRDAFLIVEAETPRSHLPEVAVALVLLAFASVNLIGLARGLRR